MTPPYDAQNSTETTPTPDMIGAAEAAAILKVAKSTVIRRAAAGKLHPVATLPGARGALIFDRSAIAQAARA